MIDKRNVENGSIAKSDKTLAEVGPREYVLDRLKEEEELLCLDEGLYDILVDLNSLGYYTWSSCSGHIKKPSRGHISFCNHQVPNKDTLLWLLKAHGFEDIKLDITGDKGDEYVEATFKAMGNQYGNRLYDLPVEDSDTFLHTPPKPDKCLTCGKSDFWLQGETYVDDDTLEWMCKHCQPLRLNGNRKFRTPEIKKRRKELLKSKLWEVSEDSNKWPYRIHGKNEKELLERLGYDPYDYGGDRPYFTRIE